MSSPQPILIGTLAKPLTGKRALVTGASRGIGASIARTLALAGADVAISYSASPDKAQEVVKAIEAAGQKGYAIKADHGKQEEVTALVASAVKQLGGLDILVNNAGVFVAGAAIDPNTSKPDSLAAFDRLWAINVTSVATAVRAAAGHLPSGGRIINIGSLLGQQVNVPGIADYSATKSALLSYTKGWARDFGSKQVTVNLIQPGHIDTDMNPASGPFAEVAKQAPAARHGRPEEIAAAVLFVATPAASFVNAAVINVDGGFNA
jgi:3-oxoacyl-[acyl-carrier protein] reductase